MSKFDTCLTLSGENRRCSVESEGFAFLWSNFLKFEHSKNFIWIIGPPVVYVMQRGRHFVWMFRDLRFSVADNSKSKSRHDQTHPDKPSAWSIILTQPVKIHELGNNCLGQLEFLFKCDIRNWKNWWQEQVQCQSQFYPGTIAHFIEL